jgi:hypothetical protein
VDEEWQRGKDLLDSGAYAEALTYIGELRAQDPDCAKTAILHAWAQYLDMRQRAVGDDDEAPTDRRLKMLAKRYKTAIQKEQFRVPDFALGYVFVGRMQLDAASPKRAMVTFERALRQEPELDDAQYWHGVAKRRSWHPGPREDS